MVYDMGRTEDLSRYTVIDDSGNIIATYKYKMKAKHHIDALNSNTEYIELPNSYYQQQG